MQNFYRVAIALCAWCSSSWNSLCFKEVNLQAWISLEFICPTQRTVIGHRQSLHGTWARLCWGAVCDNNRYPDVWCKYSPVVMWAHSVSHDPIRILLTKIPAAHGYSAKVATKQNAKHNDNFCCEVHPDCAQQQKGNDAKPSSCATSCCFTIIDELKNQCVTKQIEVSIVYVSKTCVTIALMY